jgi:hypothetical protein
LEVLKTTTTTATNIYHPNMAFVLAHLGMVTMSALNLVKDKFDRDKFDRISIY